MKGIVHLPAAHQSKGTRFQVEAEGMKASKVLSLITGMILLLQPASNVQGQSFTGTELLARPTDHSITLNVVSSSAIDAYVEYGISTGVYSNTTSTVSQLANEPTVIVIDGLSANTLYYYRLRYRASGGGSYSARSEHTFRTQRPTGSTFTFDITSDSHVNILLGSAATWQQTLTNVAVDNPDFLLDCGDTFAMDGVTSESTARTNYLYQRTSTTLGLVSASVPILLAVGNHENQESWHLNDNGNPVNSEPVWGTNAQKRYFPNPVPNSFYSGNSDTYSNLNGDQLHEDYYAFTWGNALFVVIDPFWYTTAKPFVGNTGGGEPGSSDGDRWHWTLGLTQYNWLKQTLENSTATYKFLFMHHMTGGTDDYIRGGAYAAPYCEWGGYDEDGTTYSFNTKRSGWYAPVHQMLVENNVSAVFHGHDHQYAYEIRDGIVYQSLPSAGFSGNGFGIYSNGGYTVQAKPSPGHLRVTVSPSQTTVDYINSTNANGTNGSVNYTYTISAPVAPQPPVAAAATSVTQTSFQANWNASAGATSYRLDVATNAGFTTFVAGDSNLTVAGTSQSVIGLAASTPYYYRVRAVNANGTSGNSNVITTTTSPPSAPPAPVATAATSITQTGFQANWNASTGATSYRLDVAINSGFTTFVPGDSDLTVAGTSQSVTGLTLGTSYYYRVRAVNAYGTSANSNTITTATLGGAKTWTGGTGTGKVWTTASNWSGGIAPVAGDDILFNTPGTITFSTMPASVSYNSLTISQGTVTLAHTVSMTLTLGGNAGTDFTVASGASLTLGTNVSVTLATNASAKIAGTLTVNASRTFLTNGTSVVDTVTGTIVNSGTVTGTASTLTFANGGAYQHAQNGGTVPTATWNAASTCLVTGVVATYPTFAASQTLGNLTWNCTGQTAVGPITANPPP
ncbi:MAG TPA: hypothetical protein DGH68_01875, partial [Bacteroidetes bacterium]|nr:hypothetical protein [Bacteroidota bacterium]